MFALKGVVFFGEAVGASAKGGKAGAYDLYLNKFPKAKRAKGQRGPRRPRRKMASEAKGSDLGCRLRSEATTTDEEQKKGAPPISDIYMGNGRGGKRKTSCRPQRAQKEFGGKKSGQMYIQLHSVRGKATPAKETIEKPERENLCSEERSPIPTLTREQMKRSQCKTKKKNTNRS